MNHVTTDQRATFERLYRQHAQAIYAYCARRTGPEEAKDATADVFSVMWRRFAEVPQADETLPWLYGVARNVVRDRARSSRRRSRLRVKIGSQPMELAEDPQVQVVRSSEHERILAAMEKLPELDREVLRLVEWEGLSRNQVAAALFVSRAAIDKRITRSHKKLARHLGVTPAVERTTPVPPEEGGDA